MDEKILHVEDNSDDVMLTALAFRKAGVVACIEVASDGGQAMNILQACGGDPPVCVLLDIKLPTSSGLELLAWIRNQPTLRRLPVIMLTSSLLSSDIEKAYDLGANSYLLKPANLESLIGLARTIDAYWLKANTRPLLRI
jgi:two-component system response regulator